MTHLNDLMANSETFRKTGVFLIYKCLKSSLHIKIYYCVIFHQHCFQNWLNSLHYSYGEASLSTGSVEQFHSDSVSLLQYQKNAVCQLSDIDQQKMTYIRYTEDLKAFESH